MVIALPLCVLRVVPGSLVTAVLDTCAKLPLVPGLIVGEVEWARCDWIFMSIPRFWKGPYVWCFEEVGYEWCVGDMLSHIHDTTSPSCPNILASFLDFPVLTTVYTSYSTDVTGPATWTSKGACAIKLGRTSRLAQYVVISSAILVQNPTLRRAFTMVGVCQFFRILSKQMPPVLAYNSNVFIRDHLSAAVVWPEADFKFITLGLMHFSQLLKMVPSHMNVTTCRWIMTAAWFLSDCWVGCVLISIITDLLHSFPVLPLILR